VTKAAAAAFFFGRDRPRLLVLRRRYNDCMIPHRMTAVAIALTLLFCLGIAHAADTPDGLAATRSLAQAGATRLALQRIDALQPAAEYAPPPLGTSSGASPKGTSFGASWAEWERLRLQLLAAAGLHEQLLQRVAALPPGVQAPIAAEMHATAAQSAFALRRNAAARDLAGRALWSPGIDAARLRELRLLVIRSLARDRQADEAYRSMLRFQQDYRPLDTPTATVFVDELLDLGLVKEAVSWLGLLDERGPTKLRLRLRTGLIAPPEAVAQARAAIGRSEDPAWWRVMLEAAERQSAGALRIEALEHLLEVPGATAADARGLWEAYVSYARGAVNAHHLLAGDEASWLEFAQRQRSTEPAVARAYFAYLARESRAEALRRGGQSQLAASLATARLPHVALRLFGAWPGDPAALTADTRYTLAGLAENLADHELALRYREGLPAPQGMPALVWDLRQAALALRGGRVDAANGIARRLAAGSTVIPPAQTAEWIGVAGQFADHGQQDGAQALFERVLPHADAVQARAVLAGIARIFETRSQPLLAADYYLRAAMRAPGAEAAAEARLLAGLNLVRAGLREDARAQFEWLLKNARDPAQIAAARRELGF